MKAYEVLVADDEPAIRELLQTFLDLEGFSVKTAAGGDQVITLLQADRQPDVLIIDLKMRGGSGLEVINYVRNHPTHHDLPILIISGAIDVPDVAGNVTLQKTLVKPFDLNDLLANVRDLIEAREAQASASPESA